MILSENFVTIQGEGKYLGHPSLFIRSNGCQLRCSWKNEDGTITKCDTPYTSWNPQSEPVTTVDINDLLLLAEESKVKHVVITGGEPTLQQDIESVVNSLCEQYKVTVETNGIIFKKFPKKTLMSISPKLSNSNASNSVLHYKNNHFTKSVKKYVYYNDYQLKFVVNTEDDIKEINDIVKEVRASNEKVYLMPQGITTEQFKEKAEWVIKQCIENGYNYAPRAHIEIWGNVRGK